MTSRSPAQRTGAIQPAASKPKRTRDPDAKRAAILTAARAAFAERGFAGATLRDIAKRAGVTHGLVIRHFHSKESLFLAASQTMEFIAEDFSGDLDGLPDRIARSWVRQTEQPGGSDPMLALIRSAGSDDGSAARVLSRLRDQTVLAYRIVMPGPDAEKRADMVGAHLIGMTFSRYVLGDGPIAKMSSEELTRFVANTLRAILFAPLEPVAPGRSDADDHERQSSAVPRSA
jgi:AcrR family transcriptional regulator